MRSPAAAESGGGASASASMLPDSKHVEIIRLLKGETEIRRNVGTCPKFVRRDDDRFRIGI